MLIKFFWVTKDGRLLSQIIPYFPTRRLPHAVFCEVQRRRSMIITIAGIFGHGASRHDDVIIATHRNGGLLTRFLRDDGFDLFGACYFISMLKIKV